MTLEDFAVRLEKRVQESTLLDELELFVRQTKPWREVRGAQSQEFLAAMLDTSQTYISHFEEGTRYRIMGELTVLKLMRAYLTAMEEGWNCLITSHMRRASRGACGKTPRPKA